MKFNNKKINKDAIEVVCLSDWHLGSNNFDSKNANKYIDYICNNDNVYCVAVGDLTNVALRNSKSDVYTSMNPKEEIDLICSTKYLGRIPIDKWILFTDGNHGNRMQKETGIGADELISRRLGISDLYVQGIGVVNIRLNYSSFYTAVYHSSGGGGTFGAKANKMARFQDVITNSDIVISGHSHSPMAFPVSSFSIDKKHDTFRESHTWVANSGSLHSYQNSYAESMSLRPSFLGQCIISISATSKQKKKISFRWDI